MPHQVAFRPETKAAILAFVDTVVPAGGLCVWLTGSRVRGDHRADSDWDVIAFSNDAPTATDKLFECNQIGPVIEGGPIELVIAHPSHWKHHSRYMTELRATGVRLR